MLYQFHWQDRETLRTEFVEQSPDIDSDGAAADWLAYIAGKHKGEAEDRASRGMVPMVCSQDAPEFILAASPS